MDRIIVIALSALLLTGCTDKTAATKALSNNGINVTSLSYAFWGCKKSDDWSTKFTGTNAFGQKVSGVVCTQGWFWQTSTIRFY